MIDMAEAALVADPLRLEVKHLAERAELLIQRERIVDPDISDAVHREQRWIDAEARSHSPPRSVLRDAVGDRVDERRSRIEELAVAARQEIPVPADEIES